ncbi:hypothetical protein [Consotaella aegiceratis]
MTGGERDVVEMGGHSLDLGAEECVELVLGGHGSCGSGGEP